MCGYTTQYEYDAAAVLRSDRDLLVLDRFEGIAIVNAARALAMIKPAGPRRRSPRKSGFGVMQETRRDPNLAGSANTGELDAITDANGHTTAFHWNAHGRKMAETDALGHRTDFAYDAMNRVTRETRTRTLTDGSTETLITRYTYDAKGRLTTTEHPDGSITTAEYDGLDRPSKECDALARCTAYSYDARGHLVRTDYSDGTHETQEYDAHGNLTAQTDRAGRTTRMVYDLLHRLVETIHPDDTPADDSDNPRTLNQYDPAGRLIAVTDENGHSTTYEYDAVGRRTRTLLADVDGVAIMVTEYDVTGRRTATVDAEGQCTEYRYDAAGRLTETLFADGTSARVEYDPVGRKVADIDEAGRRTEYAFDALGRLIEVKLAAGTAAETVTIYAYDEAGNRIAQTDAEGRVTRFEYDALGRETARILPEGQRETRIYNAAGELIEATDFEGRVTRYEYDPNGRLTRIVYPGDAPVSFAYAPAGERLRATDGRGDSTAQYDARGRLVRAEDADGGVIEYQYDLAGNLIARISASQSLLYAYDARHRLIEVERTVDGEAPTITRYEYDQNGRRTAMVGGDGTRTEYRYDARHRLSELVKRTVAGALLVAMNYSVDASGMRTGVEEIDPAGTVRTVAYQYDPLKRLTSETIVHRDADHHRTSTWTYDKVGNRLTQAVIVGAASAATTTYTYDGNDRLLDETTHGATTTYTYDANGNTLSRTGPDGHVAYAYDDANRLIQASGPEGVTAYVYDADGLRVRQTHTAPGGLPTTTWYVQDRAYPYAQVIETWESEGTGPRRLAATYTFADDLVSQTRYAEDGTPATHFVQADGFGSTRWLTDATGAVTDSIDYDAFGVEIARQGITDVEHLYRGERFDSLLAAYDLRARLYTPANGRFLTMDTFAGFSMDPHSLHKYAFNHNDPVNRIDPTGNVSMVSVMGGIGVAAVVGMATIAAIDNWKKRPGASPSSLPSLWDAIALPMFRAKANAEADSAAVAAVRVRKEEREEGHHTIPVYLCGGMGQDTSLITQSQHQQIHAGLTSVYVIKKFSEDYATKVLFGGRRSEDIVLDIALTPQGRGAIANAIDSFYYYGGWDSFGTPTIRQVFNQERPLYVSGARTSLPWCTRTGQP